jgi:ATP-dependent DNA helicase PIF1
VAEEIPVADPASTAPVDPSVPSSASPPLPPDAFLDQIELSTGHFQRGQGVDEAGLEEAAGLVPDAARGQFSPDAPTPCAFITGRAGTGKTTAIRERCAGDPSYAALSSSTGISAINLNTVTIHSLLGFFDTDSLRDAYLHGSAQRRLRKVADEGFRNVAIDECSMIGRETLDLLVRVFDDVNLHREEKGEKPVGLILLGDFGQLASIADRPPEYQPTPGRRGKRLPTPWCFESQFWEARFGANETKLTKVWRQADPRFLAALDFARAGRGRDALAVLRSAGMAFADSVDMQFKGTTVVGKNDEVDRINQLRLDRERGRLISLPSRRWAAGGKIRPEWKHVPERTILREGCYVMILANQYDEGRMVYANGDCGWVRGIESAPGSPPSIMVELVRTGEVVAVRSLIRDIAYLDKPNWAGGVEWEEQGKDSDGRFLPQPHYRKSKQRYVVGQLEYYPLRLSYATTLHKAQGLTMDACQVDLRSWMMKSPAMVYTSLSRCRTLAGLRLVGTAELFADRCKSDPKVARWL